ncbi:MAG: glycosyltransferase [Clostridia bacterium]|nr:glycosyltransferase [Clostridia bacterium]
MENDELISIIIPVYKVEKYLDKCVESVVNQTYKNLEIILVDDGGPDTCPQICENWAKKDARIKVIHKQNGGLSDARNAGIDIAQGQYLMFLDSDDYVDLTICEKLYQLLIEHNADFSMCDATRFNEGEDIKSYNDNVCVRKFVGTEVLNQLNRASSPYLVVAWGKLYKRDLFKSIRYPKGRLHEDEFVIHKILGNTNKFVYSNERLYFYLQRSGSIMATMSEKNHRDSLDALQDRYEYLNKINKSSVLQNKLQYLGGLRWRYLHIDKKYKVLKQEALKKYNEIYKITEKKTLKDILFKYFRLIYIVLIKIKGN